MALNQKLYRDLSRLREELKEKGRIKTGRAPLVCNDDALYAIAVLCPRKITDLEGIPGIGRTFIDTYGEYFIRVVNIHETTEHEKSVDMSNKAIETLKELEKKLVSINRRNRLLYMPKIVNKYAFDLNFNSLINPLDIIFKNGKSITICDLSNFDPTEGKKFKNVISLLRETNKEFRDKGQNDLYIGYPFVIGRIPGENFDIRCPLALFPVEADRTPSAISLKLDESRDILYNSTLLLAYFKFNNISKPLPNVVVEEDSKNAFLPALLQFYKDNNINITIKEDSLKNFKEYYGGEFPEFKEGELYLEQNIVLGKFPVCSSSIQKDFDLLLDAGQINNLLNELLLEVNDYNYESDLYYGDLEKKENEKNYLVTEKNLVYINDLDSSQENVLTAINNLDKLVIQGPPGTGKSQVITSLIAKFVNDQKNVLLVSEKKTALDVVYSRLGNLAKYALLIDDVGNKELFYKQLENMTFAGQNRRDYIDNTDSIADDIDYKILQLEKIADQLYKVGEFGIELYKIYNRCERIDLDNPEEQNISRRVHGILDDHIKQIKYDELTQIHQRFSNSDLIEKIGLYYRIEDQFFWLKKSIRGMNQFELFDFNVSFDEYKINYNEYRSKNILTRLFTKGKIIRQAKLFINTYFVECNTEIIKLMLTSPDEIKLGFEQYVAYEGVYPLFEQLTNNERIYIKMLIKISNLYNSLVTTNNALYNFILYENIMKFETNNRDILATINNYVGVIRELSIAIQQKKNLTKVRLEVILKQNICNITNAKRSGEIQRIIESKRKWSGKFSEKMSVQRFC